MTSWSFLTNHARVILVIAGDPDLRLREIAARVGISERRAHAIVTDLVEAGYLTRHRDGRRNTYEIRPDRPLTDDLTDDPTIGDVLELLAGASNAERDRAVERSSR